MPRTPRIIDFAARSRLSRRVGIVYAPCHQGQEGDVCYVVLPATTPLLPPLLVVFAEPAIRCVEAGGLGFLNHAISPNPAAFTPNGKVIRTLG